ncbi:MAG: DUF6273 domain-containing protein [Defluviitaleaceae bacterium]|nr:DUF6273 domain-containing protein [Defluviitaleaceae bacterium]
MTLCPVCETKCLQGAQYCDKCGFKDEQGIARPIATLEEAQHRLEFIIKPHRNEWERLKVEKAIKEVEAREAKVKAAEEAAAAREAAAKAAEEAAATREAAAKAAEAATANEATTKTGKSSKATTAKAVKRTKSTAEKEAANPPEEAAPTKAEETANNQNPETTNNTSDSDVNPGDIICFGHYNWRVLKVSKLRGRGKGKKALILKETVLENRIFHEISFIGSFISTHVTWERCSLRQYLNEDFYNSFSDKDKSRILETNVVTPNNPHVGFITGILSPRTGTGGKDTTDNIFLLSIDEVMEYLEFSKQAGGKKRGQDATWWLRTPGTVFGMSYVHDHDTQIGIQGSVVDNADIGVRPALWLRL